MALLRASRSARPGLVRLGLATRVVLGIVATVALAVLITASVPALRLSVLKSAGHMLVAEDPVSKADLIIVSTDSLGAGFLEAADLVKEGYATRVAVFDHPVTRLQEEFERRGLESPDMRNVSLRLLNKLGVNDVQSIPAVVGTEDEGKVLQRWLAERSIHSMIFVSVADHSRRTRRVLARNLEHSGIKVMVRPARFSEFDPDTWWQSRSGQRTEIVESQKLIIEVLRHPF